MLRRLGFEHVRTKKHETWRRVVGMEIRRVRVSKQRGQEIGTGLFREMCRQAGVSPEEFFLVLRGKSTP